MTFNINAGTKSVSIQFTDAEWDVLVDARQRHGNSVAQDLFKNWLKAMWRQKEDTRLKTLEATMPTELV